MRGQGRVPFRPMPRRAGRLRFSLRMGVVATMRVRGGDTEGGIL
jgi:hypothetical protein